MKRFLIASLLLFSTLTQAGLPPTTLSGQSSSTKTTTFNFKTPYNQATNTPEGGLIETGNNNVLKDPGAEAATTSWTVYKNSVVAASPDVAMGGTPSGNLTVSNSTSSPLSGSRSLVLAKGAFNLQGEGIKIPFTIPLSSTYKMNRLSFDYAIASGTYTDDQVEFFVKDVTSGTIKPFTPSKLKNHTLPSDTFSPNGEFQASDSTSYELIAHIAGTSASAYSLKFDNFKLGVYEKTYGSPVTDWVSFTPTGSWTGAVTYGGKWRRVGGNMEIQYVVTVNSGTPTGTTLVFNTPSGYTIDVAQMPTSSMVVGMGSALDTGIMGYQLNMVYNNTTSVAAHVFGTASTYSQEVSSVTPTIPFTFGAGDLVSGTVTVPIVGWSSSTIMSSDADTRVVAFESTTGATASGSLSSTVSTSVLPSYTSDTHGAYSTSTGLYRVPVSGYYQATGSQNLSWATASTANYISAVILKNGNTVRENFYVINNVAVTQATVNVSTAAFFCNAGDTIALGSRTNTGTPVYAAGLGGSSLSIAKVSGPSQSAASDSIQASYWVSANFTASPTTPINFDSKDFDSHNAVTTSATAWKFVAPSPGTYELSGDLPLASAGGDYIKLYKNGTAYKQAGFTLNTAGTGKVNVSVRLLAGEYVDLRPSSSLQFSGGSLNGSSCTITIKRIGNY